MAVEYRKQEYLTKFGPFMRSRGLIHYVKDVWSAAGLENGEWRYIEAACGITVKHHPTKRDFRVIVETVVDCLGCIAARERA